MSPESSPTPVRLAIVGVGQVSNYHHVPGIRLDPRAELVAICDSDRDLLQRRQEEWGVARAVTELTELLGQSDLDAVILCTPNYLHAPQAIEAARAGKHVLCEKPLGLDAAQVRSMYEVVRESEVVHMTAFTYRFAPSMLFLNHLVSSGVLGEPRHFRSQRFLDLPETSWGWRQYRSRAGAGDLFDMTIHRLDFAMHLLGPIRRVCGSVARFAARDHLEDGTPCAPSEVDDWSALIGEFASGAVGVWEGTTLAKGYHRGGFGHEWAEVNGSEGTAVYRLHEPNTILLGRGGHDLEEVRVPSGYLKPEGSPRDPSEGEPATVFRYDLIWEFVSAIVEGRDAQPDFRDGLNAQIVADAVLASRAEGRWIDVSLQS